MKTEDSTNIPVVVLQKIKIKEESNDENANLQQQDVTTLSCNGSDSPISTMETTTVYNNSINSTNCLSNTLKTSVIISSNKNNNTTNNNNNNNDNNLSMTSPPTMVKIKIGANDLRDELNRNSLDITHVNKGELSQRDDEFKEKAGNNDQSRKDDGNILSSSYSSTKGKEAIINKELTLQLSETAKSSSAQNSIIKSELNVVDEIPTRKSQENFSHLHNTLNSESRCISSIFIGHTKLKRLLGTLVQFANNISSETGDTVRNLILSLLSDGLSEEEFHTALQEATNFPLRDFVLPYLKHTLPTLRRNIEAAARANNQTCLQYLQSNESVMLETVSHMPCGENDQLFNDCKNNTNYEGQHRSGIADSNFTNPMAPSQINPYPKSLYHHYSGGMKRRATDILYYENGSGVEETSNNYNKRSNNSWNHQNVHQQQNQQSDSYCWYHPAQHSPNTNFIQLHAQQSSNHGSSNIFLPNLVQVNHSPSYGSHHHSYPLSISQSQLNSTSGSTPSNSNLDDEWKNIHVMLNCILGMVEKTKRALVILQKRGCSSPTVVSSPLNTMISTQNGSNNNKSNNNNNNFNNGNGTNVSNSNSSINNSSSSCNGNNNKNCTNISSIETPTSGTEHDNNNLKCLSGEIIAQTIRATEDRVAAEVKRRTEEAVQEVKRVAMVEVHRAVAAAVAESRANNEKLRSHQHLFNVRLSRHKDSDMNSRTSPFLVQLNHNNIRNLSSKEIMSNGNRIDDIGVAVNNSSGDDEKEGVNAMHGSMNCWNCGRPALETCGGCGIAKYCSSFCQHRDWETGGHHTTCRSSPLIETRKRSVSLSPPNTRIPANTRVNVNQIDINDKDSSSIAINKTNQ